MEMIPILFIVGFLIVGIGIWIYSAMAEKQRVKDFETSAVDMGLNFLPGGDDALLSRLQLFKLFSQGRARTMRNLVHGDSGEVQIAIFDYQYTTGSGKQTQTHRQSVAVLQSPQINCPDFSMRPENFFDKIGSALGFQDIDFEDHPAFSKMFVLQGSNEAAIRAFMKKTLLDYFTSKPGISVEAQAGMMFFYRPGKRTKPAELKDLLADAYEAFGYLVDQAAS